MKNRFIGYRVLKQAKNRVSDWSFRSNAIACWFPQRCRLLKKPVRLIPSREEKKAAVQIELAEDKSQSLHPQKSPWWAQLMYVTKKIRCS